MISGLLISIQIAVMSQLGNRVGIPAALAFASLITAALSGAVLLVARNGFGGYAEAARQPVWLWSGAVVGVLIIGSVTFAGSRIGTAATIGILIAGQLVMSAVIDRWGFFGANRIPLSWPRALGLMLLAAGAALSLRK